MTKSRLEAFSDGVLAIIITIMVLELKAPHTGTLEALKPLFPVFLSYLLSFYFVGIYWTNHHHLLQPVRRINGTILWANAHLLFWLSLIPFVTAWMGENHFESTPVALYGTVLLMAGLAYFLLTLALVKHEGKDSALARAIGKDWKSKSSVLVYLVAIPAAFFRPWISCVLYIAIAGVWLIPDCRIECHLEPGKEE